MQQINLYQPGLRKKKTQISSQQLLMAVAGVTAVMLVFIVFYSFQLRQLESQLETQRAVQAAKLAQLESLQAQIQGRQKDQQLQAKIDALLQQINNKQRVMKVLGDQRFGNIKGFSPHMNGLARQRIDGLWLTEIRISHGGETLGIKGQALKAALLPRYLQRLSSEDIFNGKAFETLSMSRSTTSPGHINFELHGVGEDYPPGSGKDYAANSHGINGKAR